MANKHTYDERAANFYGHQAMNLRSRDEMRKRGVKPNTPNQPKAVYRDDGMNKRLKQGDKRRKADGYLDQLIRSLNAK